MYKIKTQVDSQLLAETIIAGMQENKAEEITLLDLRNIENAVSDFFVICSGNSTTHVDGIVSSLTKETQKSIGEKPWHQEGVRGSEWVLLDYVNVVAHIFYKDAREYYDLEDLWADAIKKEIKD